MSCDLRRRAIWHLLGMAGWLFGRRCERAGMALCSLKDWLADTCPCGRHSRC